MTFILVPRIPSERGDADGDLVMPNWLWRRIATRLSMPGAPLEQYQGRLDLHGCGVVLTAQQAVVVGDYVVGHSEALSDTFFEDQRKWDTFLLDVAHFCRNSGGFEIM